MNELPGPKTITTTDFENLFKVSLDQELEDQVNKLQLQYRDLSESEWQEQEVWIQSMLKDPKTDPSHEGRLPIWENGWGSNLEALKTDKENPLVPGYFEKQQVYAAWQGKIVKTLSPNFSYNLLGLNVQWLLKQYGKEMSAIYEFGCGTGHHLLQARKINPKAHLYGLDWATASQGILLEMNQKGILPGVVGRNFNFFEPDYNVEIEPHSMVYTLAALEQVGKKHDKFIEYLLAKKPEICCHIEPLPEVLSETNPLDHWSKIYYEQRNYLSGFLTKLKELEAAGKLTIEKTSRTYVGNYFEGYTLVVWRPR